MPIAIIGAGAKFAGAPDLAGYGRLLYEGRSSLAELPATRLHPRYYDPDPAAYATTYSKLGGWIDEPFDAAAFGLTADVEPALAWTLEVARAAFVDAGLDPFALGERDVAVVIGSGSACDVELDRAFASALPELLVGVEGPIAARIQALAAHYATPRPRSAASSQSLLAARVASGFGLTGRHHVVNAACASAFAALEIAVRALQQGHGRMAIAGGCTFSSWVANVLFAQAQALSPDGSFPFSDRSNGFIGADGCGLVLLAPLDVAVANGYPIRAVIRGIGSSCDGRAKGLWAPDKGGQLLSMQRAWREAGLDPRRIGVVEAHGTSTALGDATEVQALSEFFAGAHDVPLGSVKGNIGHSREAAGAAGLLKVLLAFERDALAPTIGCDTPNPAIPWAESPFRLAREIAPWPAGDTPRLAAIDSFGIGGIDYHVVLEEAPSATHAAALIAAARRPEGEAIAIVGIGSVLPATSDHDAFIARGLDGAAVIDDPPAGRRGGRGAYVRRGTPDWRRYRIPPALVGRNDPLQFMLLDAALDALADANGADRAELSEAARTRTAVMIGSHFGDDFQAELHLSLRIPELIELARAAGLQGDQAAALGESLRQRLPTITEDSGGNISVSTIATRIAKTLDLKGPVFAADGACTSGHVVLAAAMEALRAGTCDLVLAGAGDRNMRPDRFAAVAALGGDIALGEGAIVFALKRLSDAQAAGDAIYATLTEASFAATGALDGLPAVGAVDPVYGHLQGAASALSILRATLGLARGANPSGSAEVVTVGFNGLRARLALEGQAAGSVALAQAPLARAREPIVLRAESLDALRRGATTTDGVFALGTTPDATFDRALLGAREAAPVLASKGAFVVQGPLSGKTCFMFTGQGAQYGGMLRDVARAYPAAAARLAEIDHALAAHGVEALTPLLWGDGAVLGQLPWTKLATLAAGLAYYEVARAHGLAADLVTAHSYGEYAALVVSGAWSVAAAVDATLQRSAFMLAQPAGGMAAVFASRPRVEALLEGLPAFTATSNVNAPDELVVSGELAAIDALLVRCEREGVGAKRLAVPCAYHCALMAPAAVAFVPVAERLRLSAPRHRFITSAWAKVITTPAEIRKALIDQFTLPVDFVAQIELAYAEGARRFVELGPGNVLSRLTAKILGERPATIASLDDRKRPGIGAIERALAHLRASYAVADAAPRARAGGMTLHDATQWRRERVARTSSPEPTPDPPTQPAPTPPARDPVRAALIELVVAETGYPPELLDFDLDLEADLGIDTVKQAQVLGALRERFELKGSAPALRDFPTLGHLYTLVTTALASATQASPEATPTRVDLAGSPYEMGLAHGRAIAADVAKTLAAYLAFARERIARHDDPAAHFDGDALDEMRGIADGAGVSFDDVVAFNLDSMSPELAGCSHVGLAPTTHGAPGITGPLLAVNEDSPFVLRVRSDLPRIMQVRRPAGAIAHVVFGFAGQLGGINGVNAHGLAITSSLLIDCASPIARGGVHVRLVARLLATATTPAEAVAMARTSARMGGWACIVAHPAHPEPVSFEYHDDHFVERHGDRCITNHALALTPTAATPAHSVHRLRRLEAVTRARPFGLAEARAMLRDRVDLERGREVAHRTMNTLDRVDNVLSLIIDVASRRLVVAHGDRTWRTLALSDLIPLAPPISRVAARPPRVIDPTSLPRATPDADAMTRYVTRLTPAPLAPAMPYRPLRALVVGRGPLASELANRLRDRGAEVALADDVTHGRAFLSRPADVFLCAHGHADLATFTSTWPEQRRILEVAFAILQTFVETPGPTPVLVAITSLGGDFGCGEARVDHPLGGAFAGLVKALHNDAANLRCKVIDSAANDAPPAVVSAVLAELDGADPAIEVAIRRGRRMRLTMHPLPTRATTPTLAGTVVLTGGGRGITAEVALALANAGAKKIALIGRSHLPSEVTHWRSLDGAGIAALEAAARDQLQRQKGRLTPLDLERAVEPLHHALAIDRTLERLEATGAEVIYCTADVRDQASLGRALAHVRAALGPITSIIHGAGYERSRAFTAKSTEDLHLTLGAKVEGALNLIALTRTDELAQFVSFTSVSGRFGGLGQADYALANELLVRITGALAAERPSVRALAIDWSAWGEVGMAMRKDTRHHLERRGRTFMPVAEGCRHLLRELGAATRERAVTYFEAAEVARLTGAATSARTSDLALVDASIDDTLECALDPKIDVFLNEHRLAGTPILPAAVSIELLCASAELHLGAKFELLDVAIDTALKVPDGRRAIARCRSELRGATLALSIQHDFINGSGHLVDPDRQVVRARATAAQPSVRLPTPATKLTLHPRYGSEANGVVHGPSLQTLLALHVGTDHSTAELVALPASALRPGRWLTAAPLLDGCLQACSTLARHQLGVDTAILPRGFARLCSQRQAREHERCRMVVRMTHVEGRRLFFDFDVIGDDGQLIFQAVGYESLLLEPLTSTQVAHA